MPKRRSGPDTPPSFGAARDDIMRDLSRLLASQDFGSIEEVNDFLQRQVVGKPLRKVEPANDRERAEDLVMAARDARSVTKLRAQVAEALALDPDCIMAHLLLLDVADSPSKALAHARDAVASGERVVAQEVGDDGGDPTDGPPGLWYIPACRPYLQARHALAELLWQVGDRQTALEEARSILVLNPGDNQGVRYVLLEWLLRAGSLAEIDALLASYDEASAAWQFARAQHEFRRNGLTSIASKALRAAMTANPHVVPMLLGQTDGVMPAKPPSMYTPPWGDGLIRQGHWDGSVRP